MKQNEKKKNKAIDSLIQLLLLVIWTYKILFYLYFERVEGEKFCILIQTIPAFCSSETYVLNFP